LEAAERHLGQGIAQCELGGYTRYLIEGTISLAWLQRARGDVSSALETMQKAEQAAARINVAWYIAKVAAHQARLWLTPAAGKRAAATQWMQSCGLSTEDQPEYLREVEYLTFVRALLAGARPSSEAALGLLERLLKAAEKSGRMDSAIEILTLQALALQTQHETAKAIIALDRALTIAEPEGYVRLFADEGPAMAQLLRHAASRNILPDYVGSLLGVIGVSAESGSRVMQALAEPLTERELEVLRLLAAGLTNREIAGELSITLSTVKAHTRRIYGKLDVRSRTHAAARAREWTLL
jgi:LuxR family maltose regulon positive regulatory protein